MTYASRARVASESGKIPCWRFKFYAARADSPTRISFECHNSAPWPRIVFGFFWADSWGFSDTIALSFVEFEQGLTEWRKFEVTSACTVQSGGYIRPIGVIGLKTCCTWTTTCNLQLTFSVLITLCMERIKSPNVSYDIGLTVDLTQLTLDVTGCAQSAK